MNKVVSLLAKQFPAGTYVMHRRYNYCRVMCVDDDGIHCTVKVLKQGLRERTFRSYEVALEELERVHLPLPDPVTGSYINIPMDES